MANLEYLKHPGAMTPPPRIEVSNEVIPGGPGGAYGANLEEWLSATSPLEEDPSKYGQRRSSYNLVTAHLLTVPNRRDTERRRHSVGSQSTQFLRQFSDLAPMMDSQFDSLTVPGYAFGRPSISVSEWNRSERSDSITSGGSDLGDESTSLTLSSNVSMRIKELVQKFNERTQRFKDKTIQPDTPTSVGSKSVVTDSAKDDVAAKTVKPILPGAPGDTDAEQVDTRPVHGCGSCKFRLPHFIYIFDPTVSLDPNSAVYLYWLLLVSCAFLYNAYSSPLRASFFSSPVYHNMQKENPEFLMNPFSVPPSASTRPPHCRQTKPATPTTLPPNDSTTWTTEFEFSASTESRQNSDFTSGYDVTTLSATIEMKNLSAVTTYTTNLFTEDQTLANLDFGLDYNAPFYDDEVVDNEIVGNDSETTTTDECSMDHWEPFVINFYFPGYERDDNRIYWWIGDYICDFIYIIDIIMFKSRLQFIKDGMLETDRKLAWLNYRSKINFKLDILALVPLEIFYLIPAVKFNALLRLNRVLKIQSIWEFFDKVDQKVSSAYIVRVIRTMIYMMYLIHLETCGYYICSAIIGLGADDWVYDGFGSPYLHCMYLATKTASSIGNNWQPNTQVEYMFITFYWLLGIFVFAMLIGQIRDIFHAADANRDRYRKTIDQTMYYMKSMKVPKKLRHRVKLWFTYNWEYSKTLDENLLLEALPMKMKSDLAISVHYATLSKVSLFQDCEKSLLLSLVLKLKPVLFLPGDYICKKGEVGTEMYIVKMGSVEVVGGPNNSIVFVTLKEGSVFGEISLLALAGGNRRTADVRAKGYAQLFLLSKVDFEEAMRDYPDAHKLLKRKAKKVLTKNKPAATEQNEQIITNRPSTPKLLKTVIRVISEEDNPGSFVNLQKMSSKPERQISITSTSKLEASASAEPAHPRRRKEEVVRGKGTTGLLEAPKSAHRARPRPRPKNSSRERPRKRSKNGRDAEISLINLPPLKSPSGISFDDEDQKLKRNLIEIEQTTYEPLAVHLPRQISNHTNYKDQISVGRQDAMETIKSFNERNNLLENYKISSVDGPLFDDHDDSQLLPNSTSKYPPSAATSVQQINAKLEKINIKMGQSALHRTSQAANNLTAQEFMSQKRQLADLGISREKYSPPRHSKSTITNEKIRTLHRGNTTISYVDERDNLINRPTSGHKSRTPSLAFEEEVQHLNKESDRGRARKKSRTRSQSRGNHEHYSEGNLKESTAEIRTSRKSSGSRSKSRTKERSDSKRPPMKSMSCEAGKNSAVKSGGKSLAVRPRSAADKLLEDRRRSKDKEFSKNESRGNKKVKRRSNRSRSGDKEIYADDSSLLEYRNSEYFERTNKKPSRSRSGSRNKNSSELNSATITNHKSERPRSRTRRKSSDSKSKEIVLELETEPNSNRRSSRERNGGKSNEKTPSKRPQSQQECISKSNHVLHSGLSCQSEVIIHAQPRAQPIEPRRPNHTSVDSSQISNRIEYKFACNPLFMDNNSTPNNSMPRNSMPPSISPNTIKLNCKYEGTPVDEELNYISDRTTLVVNHRNSLGKMANHNHVTENNVHGKKPEMNLHTRSSHFSDLIYKRQDSEF